VAAATALVALSAPAARAAGRVPAVFDVEAAGTAVRVGASVPVALPLVVDVGVARSSVAINSQPNAISEAAPAWSPVVETAPALLGTPLPLPVAVWCYSYLPGDPREASCGGPAQDIGGVLVASAGAGHTITKMAQQDDPTTLSSQSSVVSQGVHSAPAAPQAFTFDNGASAATAGADGERMTAGAAASIEDLDIAGAISIRSLRSSVSVALGGVAGSAAHSASLVISGVEVLGRPATIDGTGIHVSGQNAGGELFAVQDQLNQLLATTGLEIRTVGRPPVVSADGTTADVTSGGLLVTMPLPDALGGRIEVVFGESSVRMSAHQVEAFVEADAGGGGTSVADTPSLDSAAPELLTAAPPPLPPVPGVGAGTPSTRPFQEQVSASDLAAESWHFSFGPYALLVIALPILAQARLLSFARRST
jgi:hypothetical protein